MELEEYIEACQPRAVPTFACVSGEIDLTTSDGQLIARVVGAVARKSDDPAPQTGMLADTTAEYA